MSIKNLFELYQQHPCITTDSRDCPEGSIFIALKGDNFNGNLFAIQALEKGCAYAIVDEDIKDAQATALTSRLIKVDDCLQTLKDIAREHRRQFDIPVIAITGTNGKTTTKELVKAVLSEKYNVLATEGNFNNDVGVPKTLLRLNKKHEIAIIEMGASHPGDIKTLVETAEPTCGLITNVGRAHLQGFGSFEGVIRTKGELYDYLKANTEGPIFINADNDYLVDLIGDDDEIFLTPYSTDPEKQYMCISGEVVSCDPELTFRWRKPLMELEETGASQKWHKVKTHLIGAYNIDNLLAAIAVGINFGVDRKAICHALENYIPTNSRSQLVKTQHNRLIVDAYNANPSSMAAALDNFRLMSVSEDETKMAILGEMRELGDVSHDEHQHIVDMLQNTGVTEAWLVGHEFEQCTMNQERCAFRLLKDVEEVKAELQKNRPEGRLILIKGSNSNRLYQLPELL
jgi:UDP-N-acetylmuramoyl-tripeptide--D-alanyl-D-alanine ligase